MPRFLDVSTLAKEGSLENTPFSLKRRHGIKKPSHFIMETNLA
jgi:hypothetical protein